jgi:hypothetical protein
MKVDFGRMEVLGGGGVEIWSVSVQRDPPPPNST